MQLQDRRVKKEGSTGRCGKRRRESWRRMYLQCLKMRQVFVMWWWGVCLLKVAEQAVKDADIGCEDVF